MRDAKFPVPTTSSSQMREKKWSASQKSKKKKKFFGASKATIESKSYYPQHGCPWFLYALKSSVCLTAQRCETIGTFQSSSRPPWKEKGGRGGGGSGGN